MEALVNILFELIKLDMQQIRNYADILLKISVMNIAAAFSISAFVYYKDNAISVNNRKKILLTTHIGILLILIVIAVLYVGGMNFSRKTLEMREKALKEYVVNRSLDQDSLYPDIENYKPWLKLHLEKAPIFLSIIIIILKAIIEICMLSSADNKRQLNAMSDTRDEVKPSQAKK